MERGWRGSRRVCLVARIRGRRQQQIWFIMASLTVSLSLLVSSFHSSLSLFPSAPSILRPHSSTLPPACSISMDLLNGPVWLIRLLTAGIRKGYYRNGCSFLRPSGARRGKTPRNLTLRRNCDKSSFSNPPSRRRSHVSCLYCGRVLLFVCGSAQACAFSHDRLACRDLRWRKWTMLTLARERPRVKRGT